VFHLPKFSQVAAKPVAAEEPAATKPAANGLGAAQVPFVERAGYLSFAAEHFTRKMDRPNAAWKVIPDLGRLGDGMAVFPTTAPSAGDPRTLATTVPILEYDFQTTTANDRATLTLQAIPTHRINPQRGLRYAVAIDEDMPQVIDLETPEFSAPWSTNVLRASAFGSTTHKLAAGIHTLHIYMVDPGVVIDHITIDLGGLPKSYLPPAETVAVK
jgi:Gylcosyl hydrolase family 115 C-terminal domain